MARHYLLIVLLGGLALITACGGGSGGGTTFSLAPGESGSEGGFPNIGGGEGNNNITCGTGTMLQGNMCVPTNIANPVTCGTDTMLDSNNMCVSTIQPNPLMCGTGTTEQNNMCMPIPGPDPVNCGGNTMLDTATNTCIANPLEASDCGAGTELDSTNNMCIIPQDQNFGLMPETPVSLIASTGTTTIINSPNNSIAEVNFGGTTYYFAEEQPPNPTTTNIKSVTQNNKSLEATNDQRILEVSKSGDATDRHFLYINDDIDFENARLARFILIDNGRASETALVDTSINITATDDVPNAMVTYGGFLVGTTGTNNINQTRLGKFDNMTVDFTTTDGTGTVNIPNFDVYDGFDDDSRDEQASFAGTWAIDDTMDMERVTLTGELSLTLSFGFGFGETLTLNGQFYGDQAKEFVALGSDEINGNDTAFGIIGATLPSN